MKKMTTFSGAETPCFPPKKLPAWAVAVAAVVLLGLLGFLCFITTLSSDDYWYSTFFYNGLSGYFHNLAEHYRTFNGRTFVHLFVHIVLYAGNWLFAICGVTFTALTPLLAAKSCCPTAKWQSGKLLFALTMFIAGLLAMPTRLLVEGVLWISAFFNYVFPTALLVGGIYLLQKTRGKTLGVLPHLFLCFYCFLCGATTEQSGGTAVVIALLFCGELAVREKKLNLWNLGQVVAAGLGLATILNSPATRYRMADEIASKSNSLLNGLLKGFSVEAGYFAENTTLFCGIIAFFLLFGLFWWMKTKRRAVPLACGVLAILLLALRILTAEYCLIYLLMLCGMALCGGLLIVTGRYPTLGYLLFAALLSVGSVVFTKSIDSVAGRIMLPGVLFVLACMASMLMLVADRYPVGQAPLLLAAVGMAAVALVPDIPGYWYNHQIEMENLAYIQEAPETGVLYARIDYDKNYTMEKMDDYLAKFTEYAKVDPKTTEIYFYTQDGLVVYLDGQRMTYPAFFKDGQWCLALRDLIESSGGRVLWTSAETTILYGEREAFVRSGTFYYTDEAGVARSAPLPLSEWCTIIPSEPFTEAFGMDIVIDAENQALYLTQKP